jgi:hypothetical protein
MEPDWKETEESLRPPPQSSLGLFERLPREIVSEILRQPGAHLLGTASRALREQVAAEMPRWRRQCRQAAAPLPPEAMCFDANPDALCARVCCAALAADWHDFLAGLLRAAVVAIGVDPDVGMETVPCHRLWWPLTPRTGPLAGAQVLAFQPVRHPKGCVPPPFFNPEQGRLMSGYAVLRLVLVHGATQRVVLQFRVMSVPIEISQGRWSVDKLLCTPALDASASALPPPAPSPPPPPFGGLSPECATARTAPAVAPSHGRVYGGVSEPLPSAVCVQKHPKLYSDWHGVVSALHKYADKAVSAWRPARLHIEVEFPGWLHIARADVRRHDEWVELVHAAFGAAAAVGGLPVRSSDGRDGVVAAAVWPFSVVWDGLTYHSLDPANRFKSTISYQRVPPPQLQGDEAVWRAVLGRWAAAVFAHLGGHVQLPRPGHYAAMPAALRFALPCPMPG